MEIREQGGHLSDGKNDSTAVTTRPLSRTQQSNRTSSETYGEDRADELTAGALASAYEDQVTAVTSK